MEFTNSMFEVDFPANSNSKDVAVLDEKYSLSTTRRGLEVAKVSLRLFVHSMLNPRGPNYLAMD